MGVAEAGSLIIITGIGFAMVAALMFTFGSAQQFNYNSTMAAVCLSPLLIGVIAAFVLGIFLFGFLLSRR